MLVDPGGFSNDPYPYYPTPEAVAPVYQVWSCPRRFYGVCGIYHGLRFGHHGRSQRKFMIAWFLLIPSHGLSRGLAGRVEIPVPRLRQRLKEEEDPS